MASKRTGLTETRLPILVINAILRKLSSALVIRTTHLCLPSNCGRASDNTMWRWALKASFTHLQFCFQILFSPNSETDLIDYSTFLPMKCSVGLCPLADFVMYAQRYIPQGVEVSYRPLSATSSTNHFRTATSIDLALLKWKSVGKRTYNEKQATRYFLYSICPTFIIHIHGNFHIRYHFL